jgi:hypothetical protein
MFSRGRMDHFGLNAATPEAFWAVRRRVMGECARDGRVTDMGPFLSFSFTDPDGAGHEVMLTRPGVPAETTLRRADWTTVPAT